MRRLFHKVCRCVHIPLNLASRRLCTMLIPASPKRSIFRMQSCSQPQQAVATNSLIFSGSKASSFSCHVGISRAPPRLCLLAGGELQHVAMQFELWRVVCKTNLHETPTGCLKCISPWGSTQNIWFFIGFARFGGSKSLIISASCSF